MTSFLRLVLLLSSLSVSLGHDDSSFLRSSAASLQQPPQDQHSRRQLQNNAFDMNTIEGPAFPSYTTGDCDAVPDVMTISFGYYQSWAKYRDADCHPVPANEIDAGAYTHLAYSFAWISDAYQLEPYNANLEEEEPNYAKFVALKETHPDLVCLISVGGWTFSDPGPTQRRWTETVSSPTHRATFVTSVLAFLRKYKFDGIELDWEFPGGGRGGQPSDKENYAQLVFDLRAAFDAAPEHFEVSMSVPVVRSLLDVGYDLPKLAQGLDFLNLLTYDLHGVWEQEVGAHTNLVDIMGYLEYFVVDQGVPRDKMVLGLALYSRTYTMADPSCVTFGCPFNGGGPGGCLDTHTLMPYYTVDDYVQGILTTVNTMDDYNPATGTSTIVIDDNILITYDSPTALRVKAEYALQSCFRGVMWWAVDMAREPVELPQLRLGQGGSTTSNPLPPTPAPVEPPTPAPVEPPTPAPVEPPTPAPVEPPTPAPVDPTAAPVDPTPAPVDPTPAPVEPETSAPVTPAPVDPPTPSPVEPETAPPIPMFPASPSPAPLTSAPVTPAPTPFPTKMKIATEPPFDTTVAPVTEAPVAPSSVPSDLPSVVPSMVPSASPSTVPSDRPSVAPAAPVFVPTEPVPMVAPSGTFPSDVPSDAPSVSPSFSPTDTPSDDPTEQPTEFPWETLPTSAVTGPESGGATSHQTVGLLIATTTTLMLWAVV